MASLKRCHIKESTTVAGIDVPAPAPVKLKEGKVYRLDLFGEPYSANGVQRTGNLNFFHGNGQLGQCRLAASATVDGQSFDEGSTVCFDDSGSHTDCRLLRWDLT